jgi:hypothetical protein
MAGWYHKHGSICPLLILSRFGGVCEQKDMPVNSEEGVRVSSLFTELFKETASASCPLSSHTRVYGLTFL